MNERISNIFDYGDEIVVEEERDDRIDPARIKELTMDKIKYGGYHAMGTKTGKKARPAVRTVLIAAIVAVLLAGTAFAVYHFGIQDLVLTEKEDGSAMISVLGWRDTPEYQAFAEWETYQTEYNSTHEIPHTDDPDIPVAYLRVGAWSQEMVDTLNGILAKYDLTMHDNASIILPAEGGGIDTESFFVGNTSAGGYAYRDGTLMLEGEYALSDGETVEYQLFSAVKGTFTDISGGMDAVKEEWTYTAADGTEVSLIMGENMSMIVADMDHAFVTAHTVFGNVSDRAALEEWADGICWKALNACRGFTDEYYAAYRAALEEDTAAEAEAQNARKAIGGDWVLSDDIVLDYYPETRGSVEEDGTVWAEWTFTSSESGGTVTVWYERPAGDIRAAFEAMRADFSAEERTLTDVPFYIRTETAEGAAVVTERRDFTVYIGSEADGSLKALWLDESKDLIFTLTAEPGELTEEAFVSQIEYLLAGREPYPAEVEPEVVWARLGHYEPTWLPEGWYLDEEMQFAEVMNVNGAWDGYTDQPYVTGEVGEVIWFAYRTAPTEGDPYDILFDSFGYAEEALSDPYFSFTRTTVNGHPAYLQELNDMTPSPVLLWLDEEAGVLFSLDSGVSVDADTLRAIAESVALQ